MVQFLGLVGSYRQQQEEEQGPQPQLAHTHLLEVNRVHVLGVEGPAVEGEAEDTHPQQEHVQPQCLFLFLSRCRRLRTRRHAKRPRHTPSNQARSWFLSIAAAQATMIHKRARIEMATNTKHLTQKAPETHMCSRTSSRPDLCTSALEEAATSSQAHSG